MGRSRLLQPLGWYQWNPTQWQGSRKVQRMSWAARGLYRELMDECWIKGSVPSTVNGIAELFEVDSSEIEPLLPQIIRCFDVLEDGTMISPFIEELRTEADARRITQANRRLGKDKNGKPRLTTDSKDEPRITTDNQAEPLLSSTEEKRREEKSTPLPPASGGTGKRKRRVDALLELGEISTEAVQFGKLMVQGWRKADPDGRLIKPNLTEVITRMDGISKRQPVFTPAVQFEAGKAYLREELQRYKAPHYFLSLEPDPQTGQPPFKAYCVAVVRSQQASQAKPEGVHLAIAG